MQALYQAKLRPVILKLAAPLGLEPKQKESESFVLPITPKGKNQMAAGLGVEPRLGESKSPVLPLHHPAI